MFILILMRLLESRYFLFFHCPSTCKVPYINATVAVKALLCRPNSLLMVFSSSLCIKRIIYRKHECYAQI